MTRERVRRIGLTGGIACGKSTMEHMLREAGWPVLDTDQVGHDVLEPGTRTYEAVVGEFGRDILRPDATIDRRRLGTMVFADEERRRALNALVHPEIGRRWRMWVTETLSHAPRAVVSIPLLYEVGAEKNFDHVVCVGASEQRAMEHLKQRGLSEQAARARIAAQWPVEEKAARADSVIWNNGSLAEFHGKVSEWMAAICRQE